MIRYPFTEAEIEADFRADDQAKGRRTPWLTKARTLTRELQRHPRQEIRSEWSEIKSIYTRRQHGKCAFCERLLGEHELSAVEFDVEHFRPKNAVKAWPPASLREELKLPTDFPQSRGSGSGYRLLAYHPLNYASSCKTCNSRLKANYFPIAGRHVFAATSPQEAAAVEKPYLVYPLGDFDSDPESLIAFEGILAVPAAPSTRRYEHDRGRVIIAFFRLNEERTDLLLLRAKQLDNVFSKIELWTAVRSPARRVAIWADVTRLADESNDHASCVRHLLKLYGHPGRKAPPTRAAAVRYLELARAYVRQKLPPGNKPQPKSRS